MDTKETVSNTERQRVTATVITFNEENNIESCLESLSWADEIVVVDSESTDRTVEIAKRYTNKVFINPWPGHKQQKNFAIDQSANKWIFSLDADERVTPELKEYILKVLESPEADGYRFPRLNHFLGKLIKHGGWYPDHVLRLFRKDKGRFGGMNPHDVVKIENGIIVTSTTPMIHFTYSSIEQFMDKINLYSSIAATEKYRNNRYYIFLPLLIILKPIWKFFEVYIFKLAILDGFHGFLIAAASSISIFWRYVKIWELSNAKTKNQKS